MRVGLLTGAPFPTPVQSLTVVDLSVILQGDLESPPTPLPSPTPCSE